MLGKIALGYFRKGYNCSQCILRAVSEYYNIKIDKKVYNMLAPISNGFGIGSMCSVLTAVIMVFGLMFDETSAKKLRIRFLSAVSEIFGSVDCGGIRATDKGGEGCGRVVYKAAELAESIISEEKTGR